MSSNDLYVNYLTRAYGGFINSQIAGTQTKGMTGFRDYVSAGKQNQAAGTDVKINDVEKTGRLFIENMPLEEYKQYVYNEISRLPFHPSQILRSVSIHITDEGFQAMQRDPEYEKWVLETLRYDFGVYDPWACICGSSFTIHRFGAAKEDYRGDSWYTGFQGGKGSVLFDEEAEDCFWERRAKRHKKYLKQQQELDDKKKVMKRVYQEAAMRRGDFKDMFNGEEIAQTLNLATLLFTNEE